jgi:heme/copper-type cytochrome/quinol oxidase subunit 2
LTLSVASVSFLWDSSRIVLQAFSVPVTYAKLLFWVAAICCLVAHAAILRSVLRVSAPSDKSISTRRRLTEIAWAVVPAIGLAAVLVTTWRGIVTRQ